MSDIEDILASQLSAWGLPAPVREYRFAPPRRFRADFAYPQIKLLIEVEGGVWLGGEGRHTNGKGYENDCRKYNLATSLGYRVLRYTPEMVRTCEALTDIERILKESGT